MSNEAVLTRNMRPLESQAVLPWEREEDYTALYDALASALLLLALGARPEFSEMTFPWLFAHSVMSGDARDSIQQDRLF